MKQNKKKTKNKKQKTKNKKQKKKKRKKENIPATPPAASAAMYKRFRRKVQKVL